jgi:hypothetical protein
VLGNGDGDGKGKQECIIRELALFFGDVADIPSFSTIRMRWPLVGVARMAMAYVCHLFACNFFFELLTVPICSN